MFLGAGHGVFRWVDRTPFGRRAPVVAPRAVQRAFPFKVPHRFLRATHLPEKHPLDAVEGRVGSALHPAQGTGGRRLRGAHGCFGVKAIGQGRRRGGLVVGHG